MIARRFKAQIAVALLAPTHRSVLLTESVDVRGVHLRTDAPPAPMTLVRVELRVPWDDAPIAMPGMVTFDSAPRADGAKAASVAFLAADGEPLARWDRFLRRLDDVHPWSKDRPVHLARESIEGVDRFACARELRVEDVTPSSIFFRTPQRFALGSDARLLVVAESGERLSIDAIVRRRVEGATREQGIGLEHRAQSEASSRDLLALLRRSRGSARAELRALRSSSRMMRGEARSLAA